MALMEERAHMAEDTDVAIKELQAINLPEDVRGRCGL
jgi:hypothetical protein